MSASQQSRSMTRVPVRAPGNALRAGQRGLTMIELLVAMTISLFMMLAIAVVYSTSKTGFSFANNTVRMSEDAAFALEMMGRDIRMASYAGCAGTAAVTDPTGTFLIYTPKLDAVDGQTITGTAKPNPFVGVSTGDLGAQVFSSRNSVWGFAAGNSTATGVLGGGATTYTVSTTSPMLYLAGGSAQALQVSSAVAAVTADVSVPADPYGWAAGGNPPYLIISDCKGSELIRASSITAGGGVYAIAHAATANDSANLSNTYGSDAIVTGLTSSVYFLAKRAGAANNSLYRRYFNQRIAVFEEIVPNVEAIAFQYGVNTSNTPTGDPTYRVDAYQSDPAAVADWSRVVSVRLGLIMVSEDSGQSTGGAQTVNWLGGTYTAPTDSRSRRAYSTTVSIRNRMGL